MPEWRYIAQNILTSEFLHWDLPLKIASGPTYELSGPGSLQATINPEIVDRKIFEEWQTAIYAEADGEIRWGGILNNQPAEGPQLTLDFAGFTGYANGMPYTSPYWKRVQEDPGYLFWAIWNNIQLHPDGNLGLQIIRPAIPVKVGTVEEPYELSPEEAVDLGQELATLADETPFDYVETHSWVGNTQVIDHKCTIHYPRAGRMRDDLVFDSHNIIGVIPVDRNGEKFANTVYGIGKGEGAAMVRTEIAIRDGHLRRVHVFTDKTAATVDRLAALARKQFQGRKLLPDIKSMTIKNHPNAAIGSFGVGDDILIKTSLPYYGDTTIWCRITSWTIVGEQTAVLTLVRSDSYVYGAG